MDVAHGIRQEVLQIVEDVEEVAQHHAIEPLAVLIAIRRSMEERSLRRAGLDASRPPRRRS
jgi:hypothetical protein